MRTKPKYSIEFEFDGGAREDGAAYRGYSYVSTEGDTLEELLSHATIGIVDQDGGDCGHVEIECMDKENYEAACERITNEFLAVPA